MELNAKFVIKFNDGTEKEISKEEAKALQNLLNGIFDRYPYYPYYPYYPTYTIPTVTSQKIIIGDPVYSTNTSGAGDVWPLGHCIGGTSVEVKG